MSTQLGLEDFSARSQSNQSKITRDGKDRGSRRFFLSPSTISLFLECPHCFWLQIVKGISRPRGVFPSLPGGMDNVIKKYYDRFRKIGKLPPEIAGKVDGLLVDNLELLSCWRNNREGIKYFDTQLNTVLKGVLDDCLIKNGKYIPLDYKTRGYELKEDSSSYYQHQLDIYCLLLEKNNFSVSDHAYLIYYYPKSVAEDGHVLFQVEPKKIPTSINQAEKLLREAVNCLRGGQPNPSPDCDFCSWGNHAFGSSLI